MYLTRSSCIRTCCASYTQNLWQYIFLSVWLPWCLCWLLFFNVQDPKNSSRRSLHHPALNDPVRNVPKPEIQVAELLAVIQVGHKTRNYIILSILWGFSGRTGNTRNVVSVAKQDTRELMYYVHLTKHVIKLVGWHGSALEVLCCAMLNSSQNPDFISVLSFQIL